MAASSEPLGSPLDSADADLVRRAAAGERDAIETLLSRHLARLRAFVRLRMGPLVRSKESSEDLVQSVCREALRDLSRFEYRGEASLRNWLLTQAERKVADRGRFWRRDRRDPAREAAPVEDAETLRGLESLFTPSQEAAAHEELERLERVFQELPPDDQEVILLARVMELPHEQIAERMGRSVSATWSLLSRALAKLALKLEGRAG
jgi:RNA polymerase sigma-70 factor (ECF subfamily)